MPFCATCTIHVTFRQSNNALYRKQHHLIKAPDPNVMSQKEHRFGKLGFRIFERQELVYCHLSSYVYSPCAQELRIKKLILQKFSLERHQG